MFDCSPQKPSFSFVIVCVYLVKQKKKQDQYTVFERHGQLVLALNSEIMLPENAPVRLLSAQLEELEYGKLYEAYSSKGRKSAAEPRVLFKVLVHCLPSGVTSVRRSLTANIPRNRLSAYGTSRPSQR